MPMTWEAVWLASSRATLNPADRVLSNCRMACLELMSCDFVAASEFLHSATAGLEAVESSPAAAEVETFIRSATTHVLTMADLVEGTVEREEILVALIGDTPDAQHNFA